MKLSKAKLLKALHNGLEEIGYKEMTDSVTGADGLFVKCLQSGFFLSLGFTISRFYDSRFTSDFYLSKTTLWGAVWGDIPQESYRRVGNFLTIEERCRYLNEEYNLEGAVDAWWKGDDDGFFKFLEVVKTTEARFLDQGGLFENVRNSVEVQELVNQVFGVFEIIEKGISDESSIYHFLPNKQIDDIPFKWFMAAEIILKEKSAIVNKNTVKRLAADCWRQWNLSNET